MCLNKNNIKNIREYNNLKGFDVIFFDNIFVIFSSTELRQRTHIGRFHRRHKGQTCQRSTGQFNMEMDVRLKRESKAILNNSNIVQKCTMDSI